MNTHHEEEIVYLICQQWEVKELLLDETLSDVEKEKLQEQLTENIYLIAHFLDRYQNRLIVFLFRGRYYDLYSEVIKDSRFDLKQADALLKQVFALNKTTVLQVINVEKLGKQMPESYQAFVAYLPQEV